MLKCPGQDSRNWTPEDVFDVKCSSCGGDVEFFKTDVSRRCPECGHRVINPDLDLACAEWCPHAELCLGQTLGVVGKPAGRVAAGTTDNT